MDQQNTLPTPSNPSPPAPPPPAAPPIHPPIEPPYPVSPPPLVPPSSDTIQDKKNNHLSKYIKIFSIALIYIAVATLSYFFYTEQRQPKTESRASMPSPTISLFAATATPAPTTTQAPTASSSTSSSGFGNLITTPTPTKNPTPTPMKIPSTPRQTIEITADKNTFTPRELFAELNQIVTVIITAVDKDYDFTIPGFGISKTIPKNGKGFVEFQATAEGVFPFAGSGATGTLTVK